MRHVDGIEIQVLLDTLIAVSDIKFHEIHLSERDPMTE
jgi:hypothetical protein